jgi:hypothetical protein
VSPQKQSDAIQVLQLETASHFVGVGFGSVQVSEYPGSLKEPHFLF